MKVVEEHFQFVHAGTSILVSSTTTFKVCILDTDSRSLVSTYYFEPAMAGLTTSVYLRSVVAEA